MQKYHCRDFPGVPVVKTSPSSAESQGSIPGHATKIPHASRPKTKTKQKQHSNKFNKNFQNGPQQKKSLKLTHIKKNLLKRKKYHCKNYTSIYDKKEKRLGKL